MVSSLDFTKVPVEATPDQVKKFMDETRESYLSHLNHVKQIVSERLSGLKIYKIYGRDEKQDGEPLKSARKVRLKFNRYNRRENREFGSLWDTPDIVGFTVVVAYPAEISAVAAIIDDLVDAGAFSAAEPPEPTDSVNADDTIASKHGRAFKKKGYLACHYNLRKLAVSKEKSPICEIQIKSVLFDAWGAKTHDLTYKTAGAVDHSLIKGFELLGDSLAVLDIQSDTIRQSIESSHRVRDGYLHDILRTMSSQYLENSALELNRLGCIDEGRVKELHSPEIDKLPELLKDCVGWFHEEDISEQDTPEHLRFQLKRKHSSIVLFCSALKCGSGRYVNDGREMFVEWVANLKFMVPKLHAYGMSGFVNYFSWDLDEAINETLKGLAFADGSEGNAFIDDQELERFKRVRSSMYSSLAYYFAALVGSHHGSELDAVTQSNIYFTRYLETCPENEASFHSLAFDEDRYSFEFSKVDEERKYSLFMAVDNGLFIKGQITDNVEEAKNVLSALRIVHENAPQWASTEAQLFFNFHDFSLRSRLAELERGHFGSPQS